MKIIANDFVYVQKNDIAYLNSSNLAIPASVFMKVFDNGITIIDDSNRYDFVRFDSKTEIDYFKGIDWIIDYNEIKDLNEKELIKLLEKIGEEHEKIASTFNSMSDKDKNKHADMINKCNLLEFKFYSLRDFLWFKQGHISMKLPEEIGYTSNNNKKILKRKNKKNK